MISGDPIRAFGRVVRETRKARGFSQEDLAFESNLDRSYVSQLETGKKQPSLTTIFQLAPALGLSISELFKLVESRL